MAAPMENEFVDTFDTFTSITRNPEDFVTIHQKHADSLKKALKSLYDAKKTVDSVSKSSTSLSKLIVDNFDEEQVWQQLELENESIVTDLISKVARIFADKSQCSFSSGPGSKSSISKGDANNERETGKGSKKSSKKKIQKIQEYSDSEESFEGELENMEDDDEAESIGNDLDDSDEELNRIQSRLAAGENNDEDDKFFDFTGDSDDDLNFDFGPLSKKGQQIEEGIFDGDDKSEDEKSKSAKKKGKKSVTFKDEEEDEAMFQDKDKQKSSKGKTVKGLLNKLKKKGSIVDDKFFKLEEMEAFLDMEDQREARKNRPDKHDADENDESDDEDDDDEEEIDMFGDIPSGDEDYHYDDFFDAIEDSDEEGTSGGGKAKGVTNDDVEEDINDNNDDEEDFDEENEEQENSDNRDENYNVSNKKRKDLFGGSDSEGEDADEILGHKQQQKSTFEIRQEKLKKKISDLEAASLVEKPWQLMGEVAGMTRPENSLLQENLQFELTSRLAPEITEETTQTLEQLIMQRVKDKSWNDVERKVKPKENPIEYKKRITLDQEKSKQSLGEIYEQEYLKQQAKEKEEEEEPVHKDHEEIKKMMQSLFIKLDALSNYQYTPKQTMPEVKIVADQPTINIEEVAPVSVSDKTLLAPEEIQEKQQGELKGDTEKTKTDKLRARRIKKAEKRKKKQAKDNQKKLIDKLNPGLGNKYSKERAFKQLEKESKDGKNNLTMIKGDKDKTSLTSSKAFFTQLQEEVRSNINSKKEEKRKNKTDDSKNAKKFKL